MWNLDALSDVLEISLGSIREKEVLEAGDSGRI